ncbi:MULTISPECIES: hypothetical protein [Geobacillus]|uniref:hypothetical protein n=1 Tax=Geobacillus TaxID=129337 RepID=UPI0007927CA0|nr:MULTISPECIES: hypothetical protein [Geobacillus]KYD30269.1 hypothetical protein B4113_0303 [Geobacillus sp. B4113_201601]
MKCPVKGENKTKKGPAFGCLRRAGFGRASCPDATSIPGSFFMLAAIIFSPVQAKLKL